MSHTPRKRALPSGDCWCGCGIETRVTSFFAPGHDKIAEAGVILAEYGSVPEFLLAHGYGPGGKSAREAREQNQDRMLS
jgi:hypothetical protein